MCFVICCAKFLMLFCMWQLQWACQAMPVQSRSTSHRQTILLSATPMGDSIAHDVSLGFGRVCGKLRVRKNLLRCTTKTIRSKLVIRMFAEKWFRRQYCFALYRRASVFWMSPIAIPCQACKMDLAFFVARFFGLWSWHNRASESM